MCHPYRSVTYETPCTMIPRNGALEALGRFLMQNSIQGRIGNLSADTILKLARLVLDTNYFVYNNKYYRQIKSGAMSSPFTMTLANVYMLEWEQPLIESQFEQGELYGRYVVLTYKYNFCLLL